MYECLKCKYNWIPRKEQEPKLCPKCKTKRISKSLGKDLPTNLPNNDQNLLNNPVISKNLPNESKSYVRNLPKETHESKPEHEGKIWLPKLKIWIDKDKFNNLRRGLGMKPIED